LAIIAGPSEMNHRAEVALGKIMRKISQHNPTSPAPDDLPSTPSTSSDQNHFL
jgi:hypothetical protein